MKLLRELRLEKHMTQTDVAVFVGCSLASYRMWELGVTRPSDKYKIKLINLFGDNGGMFDGQAKQTGA